MEKLKRVLIITISISLVSEISINLWVSDFRVSLSVIIFSLFLIFYDNLKVINISIFTSVIVFLFRTGIDYVFTGDMSYGIVTNYPAVVFYIVYGIIFFIINIRSQKENMLYLFLGLFSCDLISNAIEILVRTRNFQISEFINIIRLLAVIAATRAFLAIIIIILFKYFKLIIVKQEHQERYKRLILLTSNLKSEIYFMKKNIDYVEKVMENSYKLYQNLSQYDIPSDLRKLSLSIAKDVHEIKKDYMRVIKGIENLTFNKSEFTKMRLKDIFTILEESTKRVLEIEGKDIELIFKCESNCRTQKHYALISILRNLVNNSIEALEQVSHKGKITVKHYKEKDNHIFEISDNGIGIKEEDKKIIFNPGFSNKFNSSTGDIYRGLGLTLVKDVTKNYFGGKISLESNLNKGTVFTIEIPKNNLEVS